MSKILPKRFTAGVLRSSSTSPAEPYIQGYFSQRNGYNGDRSKYKIPAFKYLAFGCITCASGITLSDAAPARALLTGISSESDLQIAVSAWCDDPIIAASTYGDISEWEISTVSSLASLFSTWCGNVTTFNQPLEAWDLSSVTTLIETFANANEFNQPLESWDVSKVNTMQDAFLKTYAFNQALVAWDTSMVTTLKGTFFQSGFNQDISPWVISSVTIAEYMFYGISAFSQVLCWDLSGMTSVHAMFDGSAGSTSTSDMKCSCTAGEYYDTSTSSCTTCSSGTISYGKTESCSVCSSGFSTTDRTLCLSPSPLPTVWPSSAPSTSPTISSVPVPAPTASSAAGFCFSQESTASALLPGSRFAQNLPLSKLKAGTRVLAADASNKKTYAKVVEVRRSPAVESYLDIHVRLDSETKSSSQSHESKLVAKHLRATKHHSFPVCHKRELMPAIALKVGDCLHTLGGQGTVDSIMPSPATKDDMTYTLVLEEGIDLVAIGGIFTRAKPEHGLLTKKSFLLRGSDYRLPFS